MIYKGKEIKDEYKYIRFFKMLQNTRKKTIDISVVSISEGYALAGISWYAPWRQYCLDTYAQNVFNSQCLKDITEFLDNLNKIHKEK